MKYITVLVILFLFGCKERGYHDANGNFKLRSIGDSGLVDTIKISNVADSQDLIIKGDAKLGGQIKVNTIIAGTNLSITSTDSVKVQLDSIVVYGINGFKQTFRP